MASETQSTVNLKTCNAMKTTVKIFQVKEISVRNEWDMLEVTAQVLTDEAECGDLTIASIVLLKLVKDRPKDEFVMLKVYSGNV